MGKKTSKKEALSVVRLINEVLVQQLGIPLHNIVNDTTFISHTGTNIHRVVLVVRHGLIF